MEMPSEMHSNCTVCSSESLRSCIPVHKIAVRNASPDAFRGFFDGDMSRRYQHRGESHCGLNEELGVVLSPFRHLEDHEPEQIEEGNASDTG